MSGKAGDAGSDAEMLAEVGPPPVEQPLIYVCGPTPLVEKVADQLVDLGHRPDRVRTEASEREEDR